MPLATYHSPAGAFSPARSLGFSEAPAISPEIPGGATHSHGLCPRGQYRRARKFRAHANSRLCTPRPIAAGMLRGLNPGAYPTPRSRRDPAYWTGYVFDTYDVDPQVPSPHLVQSAPALPRPVRVACERERGHQRDRAT